MSETVGILQGIGPMSPLFSTHSEEYGEGRKKKKSSYISVLALCSLDSCVCQPLNATFTTASCLKALQMHC